MVPICSFLPYSPDPPPPAPPPAPCPAPPPNFLILSDRLKQYKYNLHTWMFDLSCINLRVVFFLECVLYFRICEAVIAPFAPQHPNGPNLHMIKHSVLHCSMFV